MFDMIMTWIVTSLELLFMMISMFLTQRYVFLEQGMEKKKQRRYYVYCVILILVCNILIDPGIAQILMLFLVALNISLARKECKAKGFLLIIPMMGIVNGIMVPIISLPSNLRILSEDGMDIYGISVYAVVYILFLVFFVKGRKWRKKFREEAEYRHLQKWEKALLFGVGILMLYYSNTLMSLPEVTEETQGFMLPLRNQIIINAVTAFAATITVILLIIQGNKRAFYHENEMRIQKIEMEKEKAEAANEAKTTFLSNMSHEIRTPMNAIVGMTDILLREEHSPKTREYLNNIKNSGAALITIINDILDFSKIESGKLEVIEEEYEPMSMFNDLSMIFLNRIGDKKVELLYDIDKNMPRKLNGDSQRLRQIIINLMNNAIKFTESGYVKLSVKMNALDEENMELIFSVEDTGQGIKEEDIDKLFGSFQQVDTKKNHYKEGTGLGLAISKQLTELMHGSIGVSSRYGEGSIFYFTVPQKVLDAKPAAILKVEPEKRGVLGVKIASKTVKEQLLELAASYEVECVDLDETLPDELAYLITDDKSELAEEKKILGETGGTLCLLQNPMQENLSGRAGIILNKPLYSLNFCQLINHEEICFQSMEEENLHFIAQGANILVVDDNEINRKVAIGLLEPFQMQIDTAQNGEEALARIRDKVYDLIFMDHMMPVMDGIEATRAIRKLEDETRRNVPIIALSANATAEAKEMFLQAQMNDFVAKPVRFKEISKCILKWLPKNLIVMGETGTEGAKVVDEDTEDLPEIVGLDVTEGVKNCGSKKLFIELLGDFYKLIDPKCEKLEKCLAAGMLRDYTIEVHALKNTARMIGAIELSELFYQMEQLGNAGEQEQVKARTPEVLKLYRSYKEVLEEYGKVSQSEKKKVPAEKVKQTLMRLHDAVDAFDMDEADLAMKELEAFVILENMQPMIEQLSAYVSDVAMEEVIEMTEAMCEMLKETEMDTSKTGPLIMLVDDDEINTKAVTCMLQEEYRVLTAKSGSEALDVLKQQIPDLILLDVHMPQMDGHDVLRALKRIPEYAEIPVMFLTSDENEETEVQGLSEGAIDFIRKPFIKMVAMQRIQRVLELSYLQKNLKQEVEKQTDVAEKRRQKMERMSLQMVHALANTIDAKDSYTNGHSTRVARYSVMLAKRMGYSGEELEWLEYAALLHDIGKIGVPREIINKPSKLTDEEYEIIKTHPGIGANILNEVTEIPDIAIGARWHHERYDGKGYPDHLQETEIPELARIIGVADAYDAMTSKRSYRDVLPQEVVCGELEKGKATQFDPKIADIMIQLIKEDTDYKMHE